MSSQSRTEACRSCRADREKKQSLRECPTDDGGFETKRVTTCTTQRVIAGGTARPKTSVRDAADSGIEAKKQPSFVEKLEQPKKLARKMK